MFKRCAAIIALSLVALLLSADLRPSAVGGQFVVAAAPGQPLAQIAARAEALGYTVQRQMPDLHAIQVAGPAASLGRLAAAPGVRYAEPVARVVATDLPSDPLFSSEYPYLSAVNAPAAWDISKGSPSIVVAVVDTGVDVTHPDLTQNIWVNRNEIPNNGIDDDNNGCVDDVNGCSFVSDSSPGCHNVSNGFINDDIGHGTFVSGVIAAAANGAGMVGVARNVRIMPVKVLDCYGVGDSVATARGILYAAHNGARIINLSLGGVEDAQVVRDAIDEATRDGVLVVAAAGNNGQGTVSFPARLPGVLAVGAASSANPGQRAPFSNWGPEIGVVAVGQNIIGTLPPSRCNFLLPCLPDGPYAEGNGTSFSTPQVSGLAALMLSLNPALTPAQLISIIEGSATALPAGATPNWAGFGRVNMLAALQAVQANRPPGDPCVIASVTDGESFTCQDGRHVRMLQVAAPVAGQCGSDWALAALKNIFLPVGRTVYLRYDVTRTDASGATLAAPVWRGNDGNDYNIGIIMVYVGLAKAADVGAQNVQYHDWSRAAQTWAAAAHWNMWAPGKPFTTNC
ncbi:MAG TPA: S8 family peptidase [Dehalococcoidia bacterium]|nr:S8 family peptidase [Dehalococcoidia bacterium]